jgi:hypothetical protein
MYIVKIQKELNNTINLMIKSYWIVEHCKESKFQIVMDLTKSLEYIQTLPLKFVRASMYNKCRYVNALLILIAPMKEADLALMRTACD